MQLVASPGREVVNGKLSVHSYTSGSALVIVTLALNEATEQRSNRVQGLVVVQSTAKGFGQHAFTPSPSGVYHHPPPGHHEPADARADVRISFEEKVGGCLHVLSRLQVEIGIASSEGDLAFERGDELECEQLNEAMDKRDPRIHVVANSSASRPACIVSVAPRRRSEPGSIWLRARIWRRNQASAAETEWTRFQICTLEDHSRKPASQRSMRGTGSAEAAANEEMPLYSVVSTQIWALAMGIVVGGAALVMMYQGPLPAVAQTR